MEYISIIKKAGIGIFLFLSITCTTQHKITSPDRFILGKWKSVKWDYSGFNKFTIEQADIIKNCILVVDKEKIYYSSISFIDTCEYYRFLISKYDTTAYLGLSIEYKYTKRELSKLLVLNPLDKEGNPSCYNDCAIFLLKQDTLINICGGYTYYLLKDLSK
jgi:hypothetical protein